MEDARGKTRRTCSRESGRELLPKLKNGEFSDDEINRVIFTIVNQGPACPLGEVWFRPKRIFAIDV